jgi:RNA polymerase sigma-70 factor (ECF subfamily)
MAPESEFRAIYDAHVNFVWRCLRRLGVREADLTDVTQKVFLTAFVKLPQFEGRSALSSWLFGICQRLASDYRRSASVRREVVTDSAHFDRYQDTAQDLVQRSDMRRRASVAEAILDKLPDEQRAVFVLFELEELSGDEIAELLALSPGTVRSRLRLARELFRREVARLSAAQPPLLREGRAATELRGKRETG